MPRAQKDPVITKLEIREKEFEVSVDQFGYFNAATDDNTYRAETLEGLRQMLMRVTKKAAAKVAIPAMLFNSPGEHRRANGEKPSFESITLTGIHSKTRHILFKRDTGKSDQMTYGLDTYRPLSLDEQAEFIRLFEAARAAEKAFNAYEKQFKIEPMRLVEAAVNKAVQEMGD